MATNLDEVEVGQARMEWRPVTNEEYLAFWNAGGKTQVGLPPSWVPCEEGFEVSFFLESIDLPPCSFQVGSHCVWAGTDEIRKALASPDIVRWSVDVRQIQGWTTSDGT